MGVETETLLDTESDKSWKAGVKKFLGHSGLLLLLIAYTVFGGLVLKALEYPTEVASLDEHKLQVEERRALFLERIVKSRQASEKEFQRELGEQLAKYESAVQDAARGGLLVPIVEGQAPADLARWNNLQAIFFASTVVTTIGYGNIVPVTMWGRGFCLLFALIGIPLCVSVIADLGSIVANRFTGLPSWLEKVSTAVKSLLSALAALVLLLIYISVGALLFMFLEGEWTFFESFYFCFITMTTIGFGDLVPQKPEYMLLCTIYILIGLGLTSTIIEIVRNEYAQSWKRIQALAEALRKLAETGGSATEIASLQNEFIQRITMTGNSKQSPKQWENAMNTIVNNMSKPKLKEPKIVQIIIYETSV